MQHIRPAIMMILVMTLITGLLYPLGFTALARRDFPAPGGRQPDRAERQGDRLGADRPAISPAPRYFHGRPSAAGNGYDAANSSGSNYSPPPPRS